MNGLDSLINLYFGWGKEFIILLDSDKSGKLQRDRYLEKFGLLMQGRIFTFDDIDSSWKNKEIENMFTDEDRLNMQIRKYPDTTEFNKTHFNRAIQECLINKEVIDFTELTKNNFSKILEFLTEKLNKFK